MQGGNASYPVAAAASGQQQQNYTSQQAPQYAAQPPQFSAAPPTPQPAPPKNAQGNKQIGNIEDEVLVPQAPDEETEDGRVRNREAIAKIRDIWIYKQVRARQDEFTQYRPVRRRHFSLLL